MRFSLGFLFLASVFSAFSINRAPDSAVKFCVVSLPGSGLPVLAKEKGFFSEEGLEVELQTEKLGRNCLEKLRKSEVDFAMAFTTPVVRTIDKARNLRVISQLHSSTRGASIVYRAGSGIEQPPNLENRKVAIVRGVDSEYLLELFALAHDFQKSKVKLIESRPEDLVKKLLSGEVDAAVLWTPLTEEALLQGSTRFRVFDSAFFTEFSMLTTSRSEIGNGHAEKVLRALVAAQNFMEDHPTESRDVVKRWLNWPDNLAFNVIWEHFRLEIKLSAVFKTMFVQQLRFLRGRPLQILNSADVTQKAESWIDTEPLKKVARSRVTM